MGDQGARPPGGAPVLAYKELAGCTPRTAGTGSTNGRRGGRFHPEYLPGAVVSGRWATRGGGALQIPRVLRQAVVADPGHRLVVADAAQLEPRVFAAISGDAALQRSRPRPTCTPGSPTTASAGTGRTPRSPCWARCTGRPPARPAGSRHPAPPLPGGDGLRGGGGACGGARRGGALGARPGLPAAGRRLGRRCGSAGAGRDRRRTPAADRRAGDRGRFTRNFVVQASAADWAAVWLAGLRTDLADVPGAELVFFQHDELIVHVPGRRGSGGLADRSRRPGRSPDGLSRFSGRDAGPPGDRRVLRGREMSRRGLCRHVASRHDASRHDASRHDASRHARAGASEPSPHQARTSPTSGNASPRVVSRSSGLPPPVGNATCGCPEPAGCASMNRCRTSMAALPSVTHTQSATRGAVHSGWTQCRQTAATPIVSSDRAGVQCWSAPATCTAAHATMTPAADRATASVRRSVGRRSVGRRSVGRCTSGQ